MKAYKQPPELVQLVLEAVCILLGRKPSWDEAKKLMSDMGFLQSLQDFDKDNIDPKKIKAIQKYVKNDSFQPDTVGKVSKAAKSLCLWVNAPHLYRLCAPHLYRPSAPHLYRLCAPQRM